MVIKDSIGSGSCSSAGVALVVEVREMFLARGMSVTEGLKVDIANGHGHARMFEADKVIRGNLFLYHISTVAKEGHGIF